MLASTDRLTQTVRRCQFGPVIETVGKLPTLTLSRFPLSFLGISKDGQNQ
ncbi:hypothetical protein RE6C_01822 [Rhodopirellula europaea 6C]|uniref:Uncharacterized protein n=1 Tax=Rhodopirellula europaea 6C TaxID=1263867 RepID=M2B4Z2_9BACT|nr:hypothetical protein RE6C_01822 [Rhodopirellula europaea 6C]